MPPEPWTLPYGPLTTALAQQGRGSDTMVGHMTPGEIVVPPQIQTPRVMTALSRAFGQRNTSPSQYTAGSADQSINPSTGIPEFQFDSSDPLVGPDTDADVTPQSGLSTKELRNIHVPQVNLGAVAASRWQPEQYDPHTWSAPQSAPGAPEQPADNAPQPSGTTDIIGRAFLRLGEDARNTAAATQGSQPTQSQVPQADYEEPLSFSDLTSPGTLYRKSLYQFAKSAPTIAGAVVGGGIGAAAGSAVGPEGTAVGEVAGNVVGAGLASAAQAIGPAYAEAYKNNGGDADKAFDTAWKQAATEGAVGGIAQGVFQIPFAKSFLKQMLVQATVAQPAVAVAGAAAEDIAKGQTPGADVFAAAPGAIVSTATGLAGAKGAHYVAGKFAPTTPTETTPMGEDTTAALTLALPPPSDANRPPTINVPPTGPEQMPPLQLGGPPAQPALPPPGPNQAGGVPPPEIVNAPPTGPGQVGPPGTNVPAEPPPPRPAPPAQLPPPAPPTPSDTIPVRPASVAEGAPEQVSPLLPGPARPVISEVQGETPPGDLRYAPGGEVPPAPGEAPPGPEGEPPPPPVPEPVGGGGVATVAPEGAAGAPTPEGYTVEDDHTGPPGAKVVKDTNGNVIAVGDNAEQALQFARARQLTEAPAGRGEVQPAATAEAPKPAEQPPAPKPSQASGAPKEEAPLQQIPGQPQAFYRVRQEDNGQVHADITDNYTGRTQSVFVADDGTIAKAGSDKTPWQAPNDAAQQRAAELLEQGVRRSTGTRTVEPKFPDKVTSALEKHVANFSGEPVAEMVAKAKAGGETVATQLRKRQAAKAQPAPKRGNVYTAEPTPEEEPVSTKPRMSQMADEARAEAEGLTRGARVEPGEIPIKGEKVEPGKAAPAGVAELAATEGVGERSEQTTNKRRYAKDYLDAILRGEMTPEQAHKAYGEQPPGAGRPREFPVFRSYVQNILDKITAPGMKIEDQIAAVQKAVEAGELKGMKRAAADREINRSDAMKYTPEQLKGIIDRLPDPEKAMEEAAEAMRASFARSLGEGGEHESGIEPADPTERAYRGDVNKPLYDIMDRLDAGDRTITSHDLADAITDHTAPRVLTPQYAALARVLKRLVPKIPVEADRPEMERQRAGAYDYNSDKIFLNTSDFAREHPNVSHIETALHETLHAATSNWVSRMESLRRTGALSGDDLRHLQALDAIKAELGKIASNPSRPLTGYEKAKLGYAQKNNHELLSVLMSDSRIKQVLAEHTPSTGLRLRLKQAGFDPARDSSSVWQEFKNWVGQVFGLRGNTSVLDRIMDPLTSTIERAAADRGRYGQDIFGREGAEEQLHSDITNASMTAPVSTREQAQRTGTKLLRDWLARPGGRFAAQASNLDAMVTFGKRLFASRDPQDVRNALEDYRTAREARTAATTAERARYADFVNRMGTRLGSPEGAQVAQLMNDATLAEARLGDRGTTANQHLRTPDQQTRLKQLQDRFDNLSETQKDTYRQLRDYYKETYGRERWAEYDHALRTFLPDATPAQRTALIEQVRSRRGIEQMINDPDATPLAQAFGERWQNSRAVVRQLGRLQRAGFVQGDYFPLRRYGDYVVRYGERGAPGYGVEMFERESQAQTRRDELQQQGFDVSQVFIKSQMNRVREHATGMGEMDDALRRSGLSDEQRSRALDAFAEMQLRNATRNQSNLMRARREGVLGASTDQARNLANDFLGYTSRMGWLKHGPDQVDALQRMDRHLENMRHTEGPNKPSVADMQNAQIIRDELGMRLQPGDDSSNMLGRTARVATMWSYLNQLMRPAHMVVQLGDAHSNAMSLLGARHGFGATGVALGKALRDVAGPAIVQGGRNAMKSIQGKLHDADWNLSKYYRSNMVDRGMNADHADRLINGLNAAGLVDHNMDREVMQMARPGSFDFGGKYGQKVAGIGTGITNMFAAGNHAIDSMNRVAIAKAAFDLELRRSNGNVEHAINYAIQQARDAMPNYNFGNKPRLATRSGSLGALAPPIMQYKLYGAHMYALMGNLAHDIYTGGGRGRAEATKALGAILTSHALLSGVTASVFGSLPVAVGLGLWDLFHGDQKPHTADDLENMVRNWARDNYGKTASEVIARGLPTLAGVDLHRSFKLANLADLPEVTSFKPADMMATLGSALTGASGENQLAMVGAMNKIFAGDGNWGKAAEALMPRPARDLAQAYRFYQQGVTDSRGNQILPHISAYDAVGKALGFNPSDIAAAREGRQAEMNMRDEVKESRDRILNAFANADPKDRGAVLAMVWRYNRDNPQEPITQGELRGQLLSRAKVLATPGTYGLRIPPKQVRAVEQAGRFAQ